MDKHYVPLVRTKGGMEFQLKPVVGILRESPEYFTILLARLHEQGLKFVAWKRVRV
jgi:hypothetical protein